MIILHEEYINGIVCRFYKGADYGKIISHSDKGLDGMMYVFIDVWENVSKKLNREGKLGSILMGNDYIDIECINNPYIIIYQCQDINANDMLDVVIKSLHLKA